MFEINLVPDVKRDMIKALHIRNIVLFVCIAISAILITVVLILLGVKGGQDLVMTNQDQQISSMSDKLKEFNNLDDFITIQDQLKKLSSISENKTATSRLFGILTAIQPINDTVTYSELKLNLDDNSISMEGQANAGANTDGIDYRALEAFRKGIALTRYDYGSYVDKEGAEIPYYCIEDADSNGNALKENDKYYANWYINRTNCNPSKQSVADASNTNYTIKIWRTPQFTDWYKNKHMTDDGEISGVEHFDSKCINYSSSDNGKTWTTSNDCKLTEDGLSISESSNGLDESDSLVLRFTGSMTLDAEVLKLNNRHMQFIGPSGQNVTDSYNQVKNMFEKRAADCDKNDATCKTDSSSSSTNGGGQ